MADSEEKGTVCVTGGTGFIASWLIMRLLQQGYTVRTTVRPHSEGKTKRDISFLTSLPRASEKLQIFYADLENPESFTPAIEGSTGVFHVAHPVQIGVSDPVEIATKRSVDSAIAILKACRDSKTVKRVVYTSSSSCICIPDGGTSQSTVVDESSWSDVDFFRSLGSDEVSYLVAKTETEKAVFEFGEEFGLDVVSLIPSLVMGPFIVPTLPESLSLGLAMLFGRSEFYPYLLRASMVHVDDVASAHIFLLENPNAKGRYICSSVDISLIEMSEFLSTKYPDYQTPSKESLEGIVSLKPCSLSSKKLLDSGFNYQYGIDDIFGDAIQFCKQRGFL